jgi:hypothetical protein
MSNQLRCPHGQPIAVTIADGLAAYRHLPGGEYCPLLNSFATTPQEIMLAISRSILDQNEFAAFIELDASLSELSARLSQPRQENNRCHEFAIIFKRDRAVRQQVYERISHLSRQEKILAKKLFSLVIFILADERLLAQERQFQAMASEFFLAYGLAFPQAAVNLSVLRPCAPPYGGRVEKLCQEIAFQRKYVHNLREKDNFDLHGLFN